MSLGNTIRRCGVGLYSVNLDACVSLASSVCKIDTLGVNWCIHISERKACM